MKYRIYLNALKCNRIYSNFIKNCDLGIDDIGLPVTISFSIDVEPTPEIIKKIIECHTKSKENKELDFYFANVKLNRIEVII